MGTQWKNPPVYLVVAQVRHNPILSLATYVPQIQEHFRKGFPDFRRVVNATINIQRLAGVGATEQPAVQQAERYLFLNKENTEIFILDNNGLTFYTTAYKTFEALMEVYLPQVEYLGEVLSLDYSERVGLRYLDAVMPKPDEGMEKYLIPEVLGIRGKVSGNVDHSFTETLVSVPEGKLLSRVVIQNGPIGFPPDLFLQAVELKLNSRFTESSGQYAIIDTDGFNDLRDSSFERATIEQKFHGLHKRVDGTFHAISTPYAVEVWS
jgi:uncharacterized protein (TIGR04255 family)